MKMKKSQKLMHLLSQFRNHKSQSKLNKPNKMLKTMNPQKSQTSIRKIQTILVFLNLLPVKAPVRERAMTPATARVKAQANIPVRNKCQNSSCINAFSTRTMMRIVSNWFECLGFGSLGFKKCCFQKIFFLKSNFFYRRISHMKS